MIVTRLGGGMGNQMFQYALGRALSLKYKVPLGLDLTFLLERVPRPVKSNFVYRNYDLDVFNIAAKIVTKSEIPWPHRSYFSGQLMLYFDAFKRRFLKFGGNEKSFPFDPTVFSLGPNAYLSGYWQSPKYFSEIKDIIRQDFTLKKELSPKTQSLKREIRSCHSLCLNVRRADFVSSSFHGTFGQDYYDQAITLISKAHTIDRIYVFSDDLEWCEKNLRFSLPTLFVSHEYAGAKFEEYLMLMSACQYFIIPNSSFAWWAAWLNSDPDKVVVAPKRWFLDQTIDTKDLIPEGWVRL